MYELKYHIVWVLKYRRAILDEPVASALKRIFKGTAERYGFEIVEQAVMPDHVHLFVSAPPRFSPALIANHLKGYSSRFLRKKYPHLKKLYGKEHLWTSSYYVGTAGNISAETIRRYIVECPAK